MKRVGNSLARCRQQLPTLFCFHSLASTQRMKLRALGNERERSGTV
nr:MAG TPA: hypothetical protein [Caudoviricetes sp.]